MIRFFRDGFMKMETLPDWNDELPGWMEEQDLKSRDGSLSYLWRWRRLNIRQDGVLTQLKKPSAILNYLMKQVMKKKMMMKNHLSYL